MLVGALAGAGCSASTSPADQGVVDLSGLGCTKDTECKGDRICIDGRCVSPAGGEAGVPDLAAGERTENDGAMASDLAAQDAAVGDDAATPPDLAVPDLAMPGDQAGASRDLAVPDLAVPDLATPDAARGDLAQRDLVSRDLAAPDLAMPDLARPPDLVGTDLTYGQAICSRRFGGISDDYGTAIAFDGQGNVYLVAHYEGMPDFGNGPHASGAPFVLAKFDPKCNLIWEKEFAGNSEGGSNTVAVDAQGNVALGGIVYAHPIDFGGGPLTSPQNRGVCNCDAFVARYDKNGKYLSSLFFTGTSFNSQVSVQTVALDAAGELAVIGNIDGPNTGPDTINLGGGDIKLAGGYYDAFLAKYDQNSKLIWGKVIPVGGAGTYAGSVALDGAGAVIATGWLTGGTADLGGGMIGSGWVAKLNPAGAHVWSVGFPVLAPWVALEPNGDPIVAGGIRQGWDFGNGLLKPGGDVDALLLRLNGASGKAMWSKRFGVAGQTTVESVAVDGVGGIAIGGTFTLAGAADFGGGTLTDVGGEDAFVARFDGSGNYVWASRWGDGLDQLVWSVSGSAAATVAATGGFEGTVDFGNGPLVGMSPQSRDIWFAIFPR